MPQRQRRGYAGRGTSWKPGNAGAVAFSRTEDPASGDFGARAIAPPPGLGPIDIQDSQVV